jgi:hypothetical protein
MLGLIASGIDRVEKVTKAASRQVQVLMTFSLLVDIFLCRTGQQGVFIAFSHDILATVWSICPLHAGDFNAGRESSVASLEFRL